LFLGGALIAMPLCFKQSSICSSIGSQVGLLFWFCSFNLFLPFHCSVCPNQKWFVILVMPFLVLLFNPRYVGKQNLICFKVVAQSH
jgi:hypothetical protein